MKLRDFLKQFENCDPEMEIGLAYGSQGESGNGFSELKVIDAFVSNAKNPKMWSFYKQKSYTRSAKVIDGI